MDGEYRDVMRWGAHVIPEGLDVGIELETVDGRFRFRFDRPDEAGVFAQAVQRAAHDAKRDRQGGNS